MLGDCQRVNKCMGLQLCPVFMVTATYNQKSSRSPRQLQELAYGIGLASSAGWLAVLCASSEDGAK